MKTIINAKKAAAAVAAARGRGAGRRRVVVRALLLQDRGEARCGV